MLCNAFVSSAPFVLCNAAVDPGMYIKQCEHDLCSCDTHASSMEQCQCAAFAVYARQCARAGVLLEWRAEAGCGKKSPAIFLRQFCSISKFTRILCTMNCVACRGGVSGRLPVLRVRQQLPGHVSGRHRQLDLP